MDTLREEWLTDKRFTAVEVMVAPDASAVIATRRADCLVRSACPASAGTGAT